MAGENGDQGKRSGLKRPAEEDANNGINKKPAAGVPSPVNTSARDAAVVPSPEFVFAGDIFEYLRRLEMEPRTRPLPDYMKRVQADINSRMRGILVDWLIEVAYVYELSSETPHLSTSYIDRYLSSKAISRKKLQLLGASAMLISSKYEETKKKSQLLGPETLSLLAANAFTKDQVIDMESDVLKSLEFNLGTPTVRTFLRRFNEVSLEDNQTSDMEVEYLGYYLAELSMLDYSCVPYLPSLLAASVVFLSRFIATPSVHPWSSSLEKYTGYEASKLKGCVEIIHGLFLSRRGGSLETVRKKYMQLEFNCVACIPAPMEIPSNFFKDAEEEEEEEEE